MSEREPKPKFLDRLSRAQKIAVGVIGALTTLAAAAWTCWEQIQSLLTVGGAQ